MAVEIPVGSAQTSQYFLLSGGDHAFVVTLGVIPNFGDTAKDAADFVRLMWKNHVWSASNRGVNWSLGKCRAEYCTAPGVIEIGEDLTVTPGTVAANDNPPPNVAMLVRKNTGLGGRKNQGRMYVPGFVFDADAIDPTGRFDGGTLGVLQGWMDDFYNGLTGGSYDPVLLHSDGSPSTPIQSFDCQQLVASQRKRLRG